MKQSEYVKLKESVKNAKPEARNHHQSLKLQKPLAILSTDSLERIFAYQP